METNGIEKIRIEAVIDAPIEKVWGILDRTCTYCKVESSF